MVARRIPLIPATLTQDYMADEFSNYMQDGTSIVSGLDYATVTPYVIDFSTIGMLAITGRDGGGRHNWIKYTVGMMESMYPAKSKVYIVDRISKKLASLKSAANVNSYSMIAEDAIVQIRQIEQQLKAKFITRELVKETLNSRTNECRKLANICFDKENEIIFVENEVADPDVDVHAYCQQAQEMYVRFCTCYTADQVDAVIDDILSRVQANKISMSDARKPPASCVPTVPDGDSV